MKPRVDEALGFFVPGFRGSRGFRAGRGEWAWVGGVREAGSVTLVIGDDTINFPVNRRRPVGYQIK